MSEYIEREAVHELVKNLPKHQMFNYDRTKSICGINPDDVNFGVDKISAADVAPVVRCKDCRYYQDAKTNPKGFLICPASRMEITEMDYCSYGALMDGKEANHD